MLSQKLAHINSTAFLDAVRRSNGPVDVGWAGPPINQFRKSIGKYVAKDGTSKPKMFYLGRDHARAVHKARCLLMAWGVREVVYGVDHWTDQMERAAQEACQDELDYAQMIAKNVNDALAMLQRQEIPLPTIDAPPVNVPFAQPSSQNAEAPTAAPAGAAPPQTFGELVEQFTEYVADRRVSAKRLRRMRECFRVIHLVLPESTEVSAITDEVLQKTIAHFTARPPNKAGKPISVFTVKTVLQSLHQLLDWADGKQWRGPPRWDKLFRVRWNALMTPIEQRQRAKGKDVFTFDELKELYALATDRTRLFILLGLNCGFAQKEIATLLAEDVDFRTTMIDRIRHKTRAVAAVQGKWTLWPETLRLLKAHRAPANEQHLALMTEDGRPLVDDHNDTDSIAQAWSRLVRRAVALKKPVRPLPFGTLRKTSGTWIWNRGGRELQMLHLAHSDQTVAGRHYSGERDFAPLFDLLARFYEELRTAGVISLPTREAA